jgi:hypothetical protein
MGALQPWHLGVAGCACIVVVAVIVAVVLLVKASRK